MLLMIVIMSSMSKLLTLTVFVGSSVESVETVTRLCLSS